MKRYQGVVVPLVTPLNDRGAVCARSVTRLVESVGPDVAGLMPTLSSGEGWKLDRERWQRMVELTCQVASGLPVFVGIQRRTTGAVLADAQLLAGMPVSGIVVTTPFGSGISQEQTLEHYRTIHGSGGPPLFIYNEATLSGNEIALSTMKEISRLGNIIGVKESSGSVEYTKELVAADLGMAIFQGWESLLYGSPGIDGCVGPLANLNPALLARMIREPSQETQREIDAECDRYGLYRDDWYVHLKRELFRRGVLSSERTV